MTHTSPGRRLSHTAVGVLATVALAGLGAVPAVAADAEPDLGIGPLAPVTDARPGSGVGVPFTVLNKGTEEVGKVWVTYSVTQGLAPAASYANCAYSTQPSADEEPEKQIAVCAVEQPLKPGVVYAPEQPLGLKARDNALRDKVSMTVGATDPGPSDGGGTEPVPGTGAPLKLVEKAPATDGDRASHDEDHASTEVAAVNTADFALTGARLQGEVGDKVTATVTFVNKGPAWVYRDLGQGAAAVDVRIPPGTSVVKAHDFCSPVTTTHYSCGTSQSWVDASDGETYPFVLRIDKAVEGATGKISFGGAARPFDTNAGNDTADIVVDAGTGTTGGSSASGPTAGGSSAGGSSSTGGTAGSGGSTSGGSGSASTSGGATTGDSGSSTAAGGDLAATGSGSTLPLVGAAAAAVIAGGGLFYAVRRRRAAGA
ncbi:LPXTG cell wall anchor domain-containing protein [Streptomyces sp. NBC_00059]|uniref:LPXTG cell wall anchor domain-containing protein n=1 Tax=Streptomyces sp. NBC_00059 TaxID=2975635 RepID=UPI00225B5D7C|nr:LPXTG cell wall anchor domain-containing protein [Streptomyces sp. NBC_00059]MCX5414384.1 LPXTG cell wall anchor domain-containing protein [Streptomyces sp. NBC_00059]